MEFDNDGRQVHMGKYRLDSYIMGLPPPDGRTDCIVFYRPSAFPPLPVRVFVSFFPLRVTIVRVGEGRGGGKGMIAVVSYCAHTGVLSRIESVLEGNNGVLYVKTWATI